MNMNMKKAFTLVEFLVVVAILAILASLLLGLGNGCSSSTGTRVGQITKFSFKGLTFKSYEGEMLLGGVRSAGERGVVANVWEFSVRDRELAQQMEKLVGKTVRVHYRQVLVHNPFRVDTSYTVTRVEEVNDKAEQ